MRPQNSWSQLTSQQLIERAYEVADRLQTREEDEAADLLRHLAWRFKARKSGWSRLKNSGHRPETR